uniref:phenylalanine 4-monooxygenase n=1 Tax=Strombidium rassoulzadegani TaxID=1082188 RepID=A0A7S3CIP4_9SPIT|mmetsp:Transcript_11415/g.19270  ORF Transcript_11415/g.19270 Transcript_11415/m.19270 type:complete len:278 (+) Transcript_11415:610-1443(+)
MGDPEIPRIDYNENEIYVWNFCYPKIRALLRKNGCKETNYALDDMEEKVDGYGPETIPQLDDISKYLTGKTGWRLKPVGGLLTQREFLNGLAFKIFHSTQYIRHHSRPHYTVEPDILHELIGHAPMFAHQDFADFSQMIGLASMGATESELKKLAAIYWFTIEFGMLRDEEKQLKAYGAGVMGSLTEIEYCVTDKPKHYKLDLQEIAQNHSEFVITDVQPYYFVVDSFAEMKQQIVDYVNNMNRPFNVAYNEELECIEVDRKLKTRAEREDEGGLEF